MAKAKHAVLPGSFLTTEEEYSAGRNTAASPTGGIYAVAIGEAEFDQRSREVHVNAVKPLYGLEPGCIVTARVVGARSTMVLVEILAAEKGGEKRVFSGSSASIPVRMMANSYVEDARSMFKIGDLIKAVVERVLPYGIDLSTREDDFGVIKAFCTNCRAPLEHFGTSLKCLKCGSAETRKLSQDYVSV